MIASVIANRNHRIVVWIESGVLFLLTAFLCLHTMPRAWGKLNTDFPNYYLSARLAHEGFDTAREYEWVWFEREKDHRALDMQVIGLLPITPFSTLVMWPLTGLPALAAKHIWILANLALLLPLGWLLRSITGLSYLRIALIFALCFPLHRNLLFGQFYVVLLLLIVAACWAFQRGLTALAGALVAIAAACKIFPVLLFVFFLRRGSWRALHRRRGNRGACSCLICRSLRMEPASHLSAADPPVVPARRGPAAVCDGECFHLQRPALSVPRRTAVAPASLAQLSIELCLAAAYFADAYLGPSRPPHPQERSNAAQDCP